MTFFALGNRAKVYINKSSEKDNQIESIGAFSGDGTSAYTN